MRGGYILEGETEVTCSNESWPGSAPKCVPVECPIFKLTHDHPQRGQLRYDDGSPTGTYLSVGDFFTMDDVFYNRIIYERNADSLASIDDQRDYFVFKVTDGYNDLIDRKFFINIEAVTYLKLVTKCIQWSLTKLWNYLKTEDEF